MTRTENTRYPFPLELRGVSLRLGSAATAVTALDEVGT
jgi:hypothetical protein